MAYIVVFDPAAKGGCDVFRLQVNGNHVVVFDCAEDAMNWLSNCQLNSIDVAAVVVHSTDDDPQFVELINGNLATYCVELSDLEIKKIKQSVCDVYNPAIHFCSRDDFFNIFLRHLNEKGHEKTDDR